MSESPYKKKYRKKSYILALPEVKTRIGGKEVTVRYDDSEKEIYMIDEAGDVIAVASADLSKELQQPPEPTRNEEEVKENTIEETKEEPECSESVQELESAEESEQKIFDDSNFAISAKMEEAEPDAEEKKHGLVKKVAIAAALAVILGGVICFANALKLYRQRHTEQTGPTETTSSVEQTEEPTETNAAETNGQEETVVKDQENDLIFVLVTRSSMLPGTILSAESFDLVEMNTSEYKVLAASGGIYTAKELERLEGLVVTNYVAAGQYLSYTSVSNSYVAANPWGRTDELQSALTLKIEASPDDLTSYLWGNLVDMKILVETKYTTTNNEISDEALEAAGVQHQNSTVESTVIDTFALDAVQIIDTLNEDKESLFSTYSAYAAIPVVFRMDEIASIYEDPSALSADIPCYITIAITSEQATLLNSLNTDNMTVTISDPSGNISSDLQSSVYTSSQEIGAMIATFWKNLEEDNG